MGRGSYTAADWNKLKNSRNLSNARDEKEIFKSRTCDPRFDPKFIQNREARDSEDHPETPETPEVPEQPKLPRTGF